MKLRQWRESRQMTQRQVAERLSDLMARRITQQHVQAWEAGTKPSVHAAEGICKMTRGKVNPMTFGYDKLSPQEYHFLIESLDILLRMGICAWRHSGSWPGVADIIGILPTGRLFAVECKSRNYTQSHEQRAFQRQIISNGGIYFIIRQPEHIAIGIYRVLKGERISGDFLRAHNAPLNATDLPQLGTIASDLRKWRKTNHWTKTRVATALSSTLGGMLSRKQVELWEMGYPPNLLALEALTKLITTARQDTTNADRA